MAHTAAEKEAYLKTCRGESALVIGSGRSGVGSAHLLLAAGASVTLLEQNEKKTAGEVRAALHAEDRDRVDIVIGTLSAERIRDIRLVVPSPGVAMETPLMLTLFEQGKRVVSEIELAYRLSEGKVVAITGTNGKTTTTTLTGELMKAFYDKVLVVGNIGDPYTEHAMETTEETLTVAEISSFQLEAVDFFQADVSALLNVTPDHLDRHGTFAKYREIKERITNRQSKDAVCVLNYMDEETRAFGMERCPARVLWFSSGEIPPYGFYLDGDDIRFVGAGRSDRVLGLSECLLKGRVGAENIMAALGIVTGLGFDFTDVIDRVRSFHPVAHRIEYVASRGGVDYYNDSKATNPDAAVHGIEAMDRPTVLIAGGYDKGADYDAWTKTFAPGVKTLVLVGATADAIEASARKQGFTDIVRAKSFDDALKSATKAAREGDAVLLSPACASWDMFRDYEERGDAFKTYVRGLE